MTDLTRGVQLCRIKERSGPLALSLTILGAIARFMPHPPNFAPVGGMSLFAGARLPVPALAAKRLGGAGVSARHDAFSVNNPQMRPSAMWDPGA